MSALFPAAGIAPSLRATPALPAALPDMLPLAGIAGSRRAYYRVPGAGLVLLVSPPDDADFDRFVVMTRHLGECGIPVPRLHGVDAGARQVLLEDLGDVRLYDAVRRSPARVPDLYARAVELILDFQVRATAPDGIYPEPGPRVFDRAHLSWETTYFREQYLEGLRGRMAGADAQAAFDALAERVDGHPKALVHRDYQSQNLMCGPDGNLRVIDYQGARTGSVFYDLASLLLDPYVELGDEAVESLLRLAHARAAGRGAPAGGWPYAEFRAAFLDAGLQRVMQALGAFCFLSRNKGIAAFAEHIPAGERRLRWLLRETAAIHGPALHAGIFPDG